MLGTPILSDAAYLAAGLGIATFGGGCFWALERTFWSTPGVVSTAVGYQGGDDDVVNPSYRAVCAGEAAFAEVVKVIYDPVLPYGAVVDTWLAAHDPTTVNRQGGDTGVQYRSVVFCGGGEEEAVARGRLAHFDALLRARQAAATATAAAAAAKGDVVGVASDPAAAPAAGAPPSKRRPRPPGGVEGHAAVSVLAATAAYPFYPAEQYHQQYLAENPWATCPSNANAVYVPPPPGGA